MSEPVRELAQEWLMRAEHDLRVAQYLLMMDDPPPESVGFHAQQCAEKALKAYLTLHRVPFERRHDLLIDLCVPLDVGFKQFRAQADELTHRFPRGPFQQVKLASIPLPRCPSSYIVDVGSSGGGDRRAHSYVCDRSDRGLSPKPLREMVRF